MRVVGLFAGIGGIELGLEQSGHETLLMCEKDPAARAVLETRFPGVPLRHDITTLDELPQGTDLVAAGFPCQDLSQAGRTNGIRGKRSGLVHHVFRLLRGTSVPWVLIENVPFMLRLNGGAAMSHLVTELEGLGYSWAYRVIDTRAFGLPQRRRRVYLLASLEGAPGNHLFPQDVGPSQPADHIGRACGFYWTEGNRGLGWAVDAIPPLKGGSGVGIPSPPAIWLPDGHIVTPDIRDAERLQGFRPDWTLPATEVARASARWKLVGNAVSVPVAAWIGAQLAAKPVRALLEPLPKTDGGWPTAAWGAKGNLSKAEVSEWPVRRQSPALVTFLEYPPRPLSERATSGFASRLEKSSLRPPMEFRSALKRHLAGLEHATRASSKRIDLQPLKEGPTVEPI